MNFKPARASRIVLIAITLNSGITAFAGPEMLDVDTRTRARIAKERVRTAAQQRMNAQQEKALEQASRSFDQFGCGTQSLGPGFGQNIGIADTEAHSGVAPLDEFRFSPTASNMVNVGGCR